MANQQQRHPNDPQPYVPPPLEPERRRYLAEAYGWRPEQVEVIRNMVCPTATDAELEFFLAAAQRMKLDPLSRQIYFVKRKQRVEQPNGDYLQILVGKPEVAIDGFRAAAEATGEYLGQDPVEWCDDAGRWTDVWLSEKKPPLAARVKIYRKGFERPIVSVAHFWEYAQTYTRDGLTHLGAMWAKGGANMISKCAEALGFRKAFPRVFGGVYIPEETARDADHASDSYQGAPKSVEQKPAQQQLEARKEPAPIVQQVLDAKSEERKPEPATAPTKRDTPTRQAAPPPAPEQPAPNEEPVPAGEYGRLLSEATTTDELRQLRAAATAQEGIDADAYFRQQWAKLSAKARTAPAARRGRQ